MRFEQVIATIVIALLAGTVGAFLILLGHLPNAKLPVKAETALERVAKSGTLQCGYALQPPYFMKDANTSAFSGLWYELTEKIAALNHLKVVWVTATTEASLVADLRAKKFDVFCGGWPVGGAPARDLIVSTPAHYSTLGIFVRADDARLTGKPDALTHADMKFAVRAESPAHIRLQLDFPAATLITTPADASDAQTIDAVLDNKADILIAERTAVDPYLKATPPRLREVAAPHALAAVGRAFAVLPEESTLRDFLNGGVQDILGSDFIDKTLQKYARTPGGLLAAVPGYADGGVWK